MPPIEDQLMLGVSHVIEYIRTGNYHTPGLKHELAPMNSQVTDVVSFFQTYNN